MDVSVGMEHSCVQDMNIAVVFWDVTRNLLLPPYEQKAETTSFSDLVAIFHLLMLYVIFPHPSRSQSRLGNR